METKRPAKIIVDGQAFAVVLPVDGQKNLPIIGKAYTIYVDVTGETRLYKWNEETQAYDVISRTGSSMDVSIINSLISDDVHAALGASQGKILADKIKNLQDILDSMSPNEHDHTVAALAEDVTTKHGQVVTMHGNLQTVFDTEQARKTAESARISAETDRAGAESTRSTAWTTLKNYWDQSIKPYWDDTIYPAWQTISSQWNSWVDTWAGWTSAEGTRQDDEVIRQDQESIRQANEGNRVDAEASREAQWATWDTTMQGVISHATESAPGIVTVRKTTAETATPYRVPTIGDMSDKLGNKVDKITGKGLSENDYTTTEKNKLSGIATGANNYSLPTASAATLGGIRVGANLEIANGVLAATFALATTSANGLMSASDKSKLDGIATGANNYTHPSTHPASMITQDSTRRMVSDTQIAAWNGKASGTHTHDSVQTAQNAALKFSRLTQAAYNALATKDPNTLYIIVG